MTEPERWNTIHGFRNASEKRGQSTNSDRRCASDGDRFERALREILITEKNQITPGDDSLSERALVEVDDGLAGDDLEWADADDLPWIDWDEVVLRRSVARHWGGIPRLGFLVLTDQRIVFGWFFHDRHYQTRHDSLSLRLGEIVEIQRVRWFGRRPRLRIRFAARDPVTFSVDDPEGWITTIVEAHVHLLGEFEA